MCEEIITPNKDNNGIANKLNLEFHTYITDPNTALIEEVPTMQRRTNTVYCIKCYNSFLNHYNDFLLEVGNKK